jgi:hypothetical protein
LWAPSTAQVAAYVPSRTVDFVTVPGNETQLNDFTANTVPKDVVVQKLVSDACQWILARLGTLDPTLSVAGGPATGLAAKRAAAWVELDYPVTTDDVNVSETLLRETDTELDNLAASNVALGGGTGGAEPQWAFPVPVPWGDNYL